ncbi:MAG: electron transfer flavoprotein subunit alpha/FixB family protein [Thermodesulfobacteriota bacterium]|nr:electron transfer flavoprotein subunit alpha/FixB family protein [Thermodesulfobacteriota bacterium]
MIGKHLEGRETLLSGFVDELIVVDLPSGNEHNNEVISKILADIVGEGGAGVLFLGFSHQGMELGPAVGWRLGVPVITDCVDLEWKNGKALIRRPIQGGKLFVSLTLNLERGAVISVQKGAWKEEGVSIENDNPLPLTHLPWKSSWEPEKTKVIGIIEESLEGEDITKADILVSVGRGLGDVENLPKMKELGEKLGGMISCSRPVVDLGWLPSSRQVGISGKTVSPVIYIALGISGQANHTAGMDASRIIIAVNKDPNAPIFNVAHYGIVDDILEFVPEFLRRLEEKKES